MLVPYCLLLWQLDLFWQNKTLYFGKTGQVAILTDNVEHINEK